MVSNVICFDLNSNSSYYSVVSCAETLTPCQDDISEFVVVLHS